MLKTPITSIPLLSESLRQGKTLLYPTDTIWGLGCSALSLSAIERLYAIKQRDPHKSMLVLLPSDTPLLADPRLAELLLSERPTTVIVPARLVLGECDSPLQAADGTLGVRIPRHPFCQALIQALGHPLVSTSANLSGQPSPTGYDTVSMEIKRRVDLIASPHFDTAPPSTPSSRILKLLPDGTLLTLRL